MSMTTIKILTDTQWVYQTTKSSHKATFVPSLYVSLLSLKK